MTDYALATVKAVADAGDGPGKFTAILSTAALDRDGEVIDAKAFDPLPKSIPIYFEHDWKSGAQPVGRGAPYYDGDNVMVDGTFASTARAQEVRSLVVEGVVDSMSVGFLNGARTTKSGVQHVTSGEMFEGSLTAIPINTTAKMIAAKSLGLTEVKAGARNSTTDASRLQSIHDMAVANGADCSGSKSLGGFVTPNGSSWITTEHDMTAAVRSNLSASKARGRAADAKAIEGSVEALQERVQDALEDATGDDDYAWLRGVLPDAIIFQTGDGDTFRQSYTDDGAVVTLTGDPVEVDIHEIVVPDADAATEPDEGSDVSTLSLPGSAGDAPASAGASPVGEGQAKAITASRMRLAGL